MQVLRLSGTVMLFKGGGCSDLSRITPDDLNIDTIAWSLCGIDRYTSHGIHEWYVSDHSILAATLAQNMDETPDVVLAVFCHDFDEALICDVARPVQQAMTRIDTGALIARRQLKRQANAALRKALKLPVVQQSVIDQYDNTALLIEQSALFLAPDVVKLSPQFAFTQDHIAIPTAVGASRQLRKARVDCFTSFFNKLYKSYEVWKMEQDK